MRALKIARTHRLALEAGMAAVHAEIARRARLGLLDPEALEIATARGIIPAGSRTGPSPPPGGPDDLPAADD